MIQIKPIPKSVIQKLRAPVNYDLIKQNKYDKFGDGDYISTETVQEILNEALGLAWSWEIIDYQHMNPDGGKDGNEYVICRGRLTLPEYGIVKDGVGSAKADKKDNSTMFSAAASFAFKNAAKKLGIAPNVFNKEDWEANIPVFEPGYIDKNSGNVQAASAESTATTEAPAKPTSQTEKQVPKSAKEKGAELKDVYNIQTKAQFVAFAQIWNPQIAQFEDITGEVIEALHAYAEENPEEFQDFRAEDY